MTQILLNSAINIIIVIGAACTWYIVRGGESSNDRVTLENI